MSKTNSIQSKETINPSSEPVAKTISDVLGLDPVLPGESPAVYKQGLDDLILDLGAKSILQVYLAEKIYDCLWWIRRYEEQKRTTIIAEMAYKLERSGSYQLTQDQIYLREKLLLNELDEKSQEIIEEAGYSLASLRQAAIFNARISLQMLDKQIVLQTKILGGLQASYEVAFNRKRNIERLDLQNLILRRDLDAIVGEVINDQPQAKKR